MKELEWDYLYIYPGGYIVTMVDEPDMMKFGLYRFKFDIESRDWYRHMNTQAQATTISEGQNWPRVQIIKTVVIYLMSHSYLTGVKAIQFLWHLKNMDGLEIT